uniref:Guanine nucleotide exchange factor VAV3 n=1 Tax=Oryzias sinensis TaxID=183150 RepID=A0A8C7XN50_9TELE
MSLIFCFVCKLQQDRHDRPTQVLTCVFVHGCDSENTPEDEDDLYAAVYGLEDEYAGLEIYEDLMRTEQQTSMKQAEVDVRSCCLSEIKQTEERYTETLESIEKSLMVDLQDSILNKNALNLHQIFISYKDRLLIYGIYCSQVEIAIAVLDLIVKEKEDVRLKLEECSKRANNGKFSLRDLLVVPMQRVLKYHLLLQELVKHTNDAADRSNLRIALDAMKDLAQYINEVKRDNETLREIDQYQRSIENLNQPLISLGRPKGDGEVRLVSSVDKKKLDRHIFLFDVAAIVCKRRGDNYEMKEVLDLNVFKVTNNPTPDREGKKWCYSFYVTHQQGHTGFELFFKTRELKKKWLEQFEMAISNIRPEKANHNSHQFRMHSFERITSCSYCHLLLRGIFNQGYLCVKCGLGAHKECLGRLGVCGRTGETPPFLTEMVVFKGNGRPPDAGHCGLAGVHVHVVFISHRFSDKVKHIKILTKDGGFYIAESRLFKTELVDYYKQHSLKEGFSSLDTTLQVPYREPDNGNTPRAISRAGIFSPRVVGVAVARYDFSSRDTRELSLLQGDVIRIYSKMSNGWWKGEVGGRVGWFPSTYVDEED